MIGISLLFMSYRAPLKKSDTPYKLFDEAGDFVINFPATDIVKACYTCGFRTGRTTDNFE